MMAGCNRSKGISLGSRVLSNRALHGHGEDESRGCFDGRR